MLLEKLLKEFNFDTNTFTLEESKLFDQYFEQILISKGTFSMSNISFTLQTRSTFNVQTIVDSIIYRIDKKQVNELYTAIPKVKTIFEDLNAILLNKLLKRSIDLIKYSPEQYYQQMIEEYGITLNYIPLKDIASYLGITPQALSRIRKRIF